MIVKKLWLNTTIEITEDVLPILLIPQLDCYCDYRAYNLRGQRRTTFYEGEPFIFAPSLFELYTTYELYVSKSWECMTIRLQGMF